MKAVWFFTGVCAVSCVALVGLAFQQPPAAPKQTDPAPTAAESVKDSSRIVLDVTRVNMLFTVTDRKGRFITDLTEKDFDVIENKKKQTIQQSSQVLLLDDAVLLDEDPGDPELFARPGCVTGAGREHDRRDCGHAGFPNIR